MSTSVNDLKKQLQKFLADPSADQEFRVWLAFALRDSHKANNPEFEGLLHGVEQAFSEASDGHYTPEELRALLVSFAQEPIAVNQMISTQAFVFSQSVNRPVGETVFPAFPATPASSGTSPAVVFGLIECHQG
jgi:hypothetical protein